MLDGFTYPSPTFVGGVSGAKGMAAAQCAPIYQDLFVN